VKKLIRGILKLIAKFFGLEIGIVRIKALVATKYFIRRKSSCKPYITWDDIKKISKKKNTEIHELVVNLQKGIYPKNWDQLVKISTFVKLIEDHEVYNSMLKEYDNEIDFLKPIKSKEFKGTGSGEGTLNSYRKIQSNGTIYFEKIYNNDTIAFKKMVFFYENLLPQLNCCKVRVPKLLHLSIGTKISVAYFEFVDLVRPTIDEALKLANDTTICFYCLDVDCSINPDFYNIKLDDRYKKKFYHLENNFPYNYNIKNIEKKIFLFNRFLTHSDLATVNLGLPNYLIDIDKIGFYPIGVDTAGFMAYYFKFNSLEEIHEYLHCNYEDLRGIATIEHWREFIISTMYFYMVYNTRNISIEMKRKICEYINNN